MHHLGKIGLFLILFLSSTVRSTEAAQLHLTWKDVATGEDGFAIERSPSPSSPFVQIASVWSGTAAYTDSTVTEGNTYCYRTRSFSAFGTSPYSNVSCSTVPKALTLRLVLTGNGKGSVQASPSSLSCSTTCTLSRASSAAITLTAIPAADSHFVGWQGTTCRAAKTCTILSNQTTQVFAVFERNKAK
jgi:hypothetical protein